MKAKISIILLCLFILICTTKAEDRSNVASGLLFKTKTDQIDERTSLDLFNGDYLKYKDNLEISFEISIWDARRFGYVLRFLNKDNKEISLVFVNFRGKDNLFFDFNSNITNKSIQIPVEGESLLEGKWLPLSIKLDMQKDEAVITLQEKQHKCNNIGLHNPSELKIIFGLYGINLDVPAMAIKNIKIKENDRLKYSFPLNEATGNEVHDGKGRVCGSVKNPVWLINRHFNWEKVAQFRSECTAGVAYDGDKQHVFIIDRDSVHIFKTNMRQIFVHSIDDTGFSITSGEAIYNPKLDVCYIYNLNDENTSVPSMAVLDMETYKIKFRGDPDLANRLHHHNVFFDAGNDTLFILGGYGNFSYSNKVYSYRQETDQWVNVPVSGDILYPRFFSASGKGRTPSEQLIFGGFGNQSGRQELGGKNLYDLISFDTKTKKITKLWENTSIDSLFVPCNNLILSEDKHSFYTLCYPHHMAKTELRMYKFDIDNGSYEIVSNPIPILSEEIATGVYLFYNEIRHEFVAIVREYINRDESEIRIYTLSSPPVSESTLINHTAKANHIWLILSSILLIIVAVISMYLLKKRKDKKKQQLLTVSDIPSGMELRIKMNSLYIFGDFMAFDKKGVNITYRFSTKLRLLLALLLFNSEHADDGISTEQLTADLWQGRSVAQAKNIRGVTINHLRKILADIDGIQLIHEDSRWHLDIDSEIFYCDYMECLKAVNRISSGEGDIISDTEKLLHITKRGDLLPNLYTLWIDRHKENFENHVTKSLYTQLESLYNRKAFDSVVVLSEILFAFDPLNEDVLALVIKALKKQEMPEQAQKVYSRFCIRFEAQLGESFGKNFISY